ncbi:MAG: TonB-dependent receptor [Bryobacteraceae bacterium]|nr:TonB-dependent receptor [Bryobacteraceae bacterium]
MKRLTCVFLLAALGAWAQQDRATLTGVVTDPTGAVIPDVKVTVTNTDTNAVYESATNETGQYRVPNLPVGSYRITFEMQGFKSTVREGVMLNVAQVARIDAQLQVGDTAESVEVTAEAPLLQTETPEVGTVLNNRTVVDMPLGFSGGRYAEDFAYRLTPGVAGNNWESRINGSPAFSKEVMLDGASATIYIGGSFVESSPSIEALTEFKVQTSGMSAEFGRTGGGIFNFVLKSGANELHGTAMGQIHNESFDANSFANNFYGRERRRDRRHNYAFSGGGPVYLPKIYNGRNKSFWYLAYERYNESFAGGGSPGVTVPIPEWWDGDMSRYLTTERLGTDALGRDVFRGMIFDPASTRTVNGAAVRDPFPGNIIPSNRISQVSRNLAQIFQQHYMPEVRDSSGQYALINNAFFPVSNQAGFTQNQFSVKGDHYLSAAHKLSGSYVYVDRPRILLDQGGVWDFNDPVGGPLSRARLQHVRSWYGRMAYDWTVSPVILNHLQVGFNRQRNPSLSQHVGENGAQVLGLQGLTRDYNYPEIDIQGGDRVNFPLLGYQTNDFLAGQNWQVIDTVSWIHRKHSIRMGADYRLTWMRARDARGPARFNFNSDVTGLQGFNQTGHPFASMLLGEVQSAEVYIDTPVGSKYVNWALFVQDDWKVSDRLTLNLGLRWDYQPPPREQYGRYPNFNPDLIDPAWNLPGALEYAVDQGVRTFGKSDWRDFSPRIGFAYQLLSKTVVRSGYGIFYHGRNPNGWSGVPWGNKTGFQQLNTVQSTTGIPAFNWDTGYPGTTMTLPRNPSLASTSPFAWGPVSWDRDSHRVGYTQQWNFNIQQELTRSMALDIGYVGSKTTGAQANELRQLNQLNPRFLALGNVLDQWVDRQSDIPAAAAAMGARYPYSEGYEWVPVWQTLLPFPQLPSWSPIYSAFSPLGMGTYHSLQLQLNKRYSNGLEFLSNYTWSKTIDNLNSAFGDTWGMNWGRPMDYYNLSLDKSVSAVDRTHWVKIGVTYELPFGRGRRYGSQLNRAVDFVAGGWRILYIGNYSSGEPIGLTSTGTSGNFSTNRPVVTNPDGRPLALDWNRSNFDMSRISEPNTAHRYFDTSLFRNTGQYERGNAAYRYSQLRSPAFLFDDFSLHKNFRPTEAVRVQFRAEFLNLFNRHRLGEIETDASSPLFGQVTGVTDWIDPRKIQFGIRAEF